MTTTIHNCLQPLSKQLHPCHAIMAHHNSTEKIVTLNIHDTRTIPASIVHNQIGKLVSPQCEIALVGPAIVYLVASRFVGLYYILQNNHCTCPKGRIDPTCKHLECVAESQAIQDDDLMSHIEDTPLYGAVRRGKIVQVTWNQLTKAEQRDARNAMFNPCAIA